MTRTRSTNPKMADGRPTARGRGVAREGGVSAGGESSSARGGGGVAANYDTLISRALSRVEVKGSVINRGIRLYEKGRVYDNKLYPWIFTVSGEGTRAKGTTLYSVDLTTPSCSCRYHQMTQTMCKHIVAATARYQHRKEAD